MASFDSPLGSKKVNSGSFREFTVPDESEYEGKEVTINSGQEIDYESLNSFQAKSTKSSKELSEIDREFREAKEMKRTGKERLSDGARRRIEHLIGMTKTTREVEIEKIKYTFESLKAKDYRSAMMDASEFDGTPQFIFELRKQLLGRSLKSVGSYTVEELIDSTNFSDKLYFLDELDETLLNRLYDEYFKMSDEANKKYSLVSKKDVKEVFEDLKK